MSEVGTPNGTLSDATIGIITALPLELAAVRRVFACEEAVVADGDGSGRTYFLTQVPSRFGGAHVVAVASLVEMGNNFAAIRAMQLIRHCGRARYIIMVGIAGAIPQPNQLEDHVRLGDIVVSNRYGVFQHDLGKLKPDGSFSHRAAPRPPAPELLEAVNRLVSDACLQKRPWEDSIALIAAQGDEWKRPPEGEDRLLDNGVVIPHPADPTRRPACPRIFLAPIASGNIVLTNQARRDDLAKQFGVKAVEMEGSGVADAAIQSNLGYLVVRGTCDYCDGDKRDVWQAHAALIAASYARAILEVFPPTPPRPLLPNAGGTLDGRRVSALRPDVRITPPAGTRRLGGGFGSGSADIRTTLLPGSASMAHIQLETSMEDEAETEIAGEVANLSAEVSDILPSPVPGVADGVQKFQIEETLRRLLKRIAALQEVLEMERASAVAVQVENLLTQYEALINDDLRRRCYLQLAGVAAAMARHEARMGLKPDTTKAQVFLQKAER